MAVTLTTVANTKIKVRWNEPYVSEGLNQKFSGVIPAGIYRGFVLTTNVTALSVTLDDDPTYGDHLAVYDTVDGYALTIRDLSSGPISLPLSDASLVGQTVVIVIEAEYAAGVDNTSASIKAYRLADYEALSAGLKQEILVLGTVSVPASGPILATAITCDRRTYAWVNDAPGRIEWTPLIKNGGFACWGGGEDVTRLSIPGWSITQLSRGKFARTGTTPKTGLSALAYDVTTALEAAGGILTSFIGIPVVQGQKVRIRFGIKCLKAASAGTLIAYLNYLNAGCDYSAATEIGIPIGSVDASYRTIERIVAVPASVSVLASFSLALSGATYASIGEAFLVDDVQVWLEPSAADGMRGYAEPIRQYVNTGGLSLESIDEEGNFNDAAEISYDTGTVSLKRRGSNSLTVGLYSGGNVRGASVTTVEADVRHGERTIALSALDMQTTTPLACTLELIGTDPYLVRWVTTAISGKVIGRLPVSVGDKIKRVYGRVEDSADHWTMRVTKVNLGTGAVSAIGATDTSSGTAYDTLDAGMLTETVNSGFAYYVVFSGGSSTFGETVVGAELVIDRTA